MRFMHRSAFLKYLCVRSRYQRKAFEMLCPVKNVCANGMWQHGFADTQEELDLSQVATSRLHMRLQYCIAFS